MPRSWKHGLNSGVMESRS